MLTCHLYARVSTNDQDTGAQLLGLHKAGQRYPDHAKKITEDIGSGAKPWRERGLAAIIATSAPGDVLIVPEVSRIGRNTADVLDFLAHAAHQKLTVHIEKSGHTIGDNLHSKIFTTVLALAAEIERDFLRSRTREGMAQARAAGKQIGRPTGPVKIHHLDGYRTQIAELITKELPKASICKLLSISRRELATHLNRIEKGII